MVQGSGAPLQAEGSELERIVDGRKERLSREAFRDWDRGVKGSLTRHEATCALLEVFGVKPGQVRPLDPLALAANLAARLTQTGFFLSLSLSLLTTYQAELDALFLGAEEEGLRLARFERHCRERHLLRDRGEEVRDAFKAFDARGSGYISRERCLETFATHAGFVPRDVVELVFEEIDIDGDGKISFRDFARVWNSAEGSTRVDLTESYALSLHEDRLRLA